MSNSNWTGRTPRTTQQTFGPYSSRDVAPMPHKPTRGERITDAMFAIALGLICAAGIVSWLVR